MKNTIKALAILSFVLMAFASSAQDKQYISNLYKTDSVGADGIVKDIVSSTGKDFKFNSRQVKDNIVVYFYEPVDKKGNDLMIALNSFMEGQNRDLGVVGTKVFKLKSINGTFLDLYPFWKKHISDKLTPEQITTNGIGDTFIVSPPSNFKKLRFRKYQDLIWSIDCI